jgi:hypothetical protein
LRCSEVSLVSTREREQCERNTRGTAEATGGGEISSAAGEKEEQRETDLTESPKSSSTAAANRPGDRFRYDTRRWAKQSPSHGSHPVKNEKKIRKPVAPTQKATAGFTTRETQ